MQRARSRETSSYRSGEALGEWGRLSLVGRVAMIWARWCEVWKEEGDPGPYLCSSHPGSSSPARPTFPDTFWGPVGEGDFPIPQPPPKDQ